MGPLDQQKSSTDALFASPSQPRSRAPTTRTTMRTTLTHPRTPSRRTRRRTTTMMRKRMRVSHFGRSVCPIAEADLCDPLIQLKYVAPSSAVSPKTFPPEFPSAPSLVLPCPPPSPSPFGAPTPLRREFAAHVVAWKGRTLGGIEGQVQASSELECGLVLQVVLTNFVRRSIVSRAGANEQDEMRCRVR